MKITCGFRWWGCAIAFCACLGVMPFRQAFSQEKPADSKAQPNSNTTTTPGDDGQDQLPPAEWGPELLDGILSSPNGDAQEGLLRATFAAGPALIPQLTTALKDDRTAEYAAQSLAYMGGEQALDILWKLLSDTRDLNLRRFTYGALAEYDSPEATDLLLDIVAKSDHEPDRTVTETAIIALTVRTDPKLIPRLAALGDKLQDVVIRDDIENASTVIGARAKYLASPEGQKAGGSIDAAVRTYFIPALEPANATGNAPAQPPSKVPGKAPAPPSPPKAQPLVSVNVRNITLSPDGNRALARVVFEDADSMAYYDFVLQKRFGNWTLASVWLGPEIEKPGNLIRDAAGIAPSRESDPPQ